MNTVLRTEKKYLLTMEEFLKYSAFLEKFMLQDSHNGARGYCIRSLYFDSVYDRDYYEKEDGVEMRRKIRLRIYDPKADFAMLEIKQKEGASQLKRSLRISRADAEQMTKGRYDGLLKYEEPLAAECYGILNLYGYRPKTIVQYNRKAFVAKENKIRVTFDNNLIATEACFDIFSEQLLMYPVMDPFNLVLEVKYNGFLLSYIQDLLQMVDKNQTSVSKYCLARQQSFSV